MNKEEDKLIKTSEEDVSISETTKKRKLNDDQDEEYNKKQSKEIKKTDKSIESNKETTTIIEETIPHIPKELVITLEDLSLSSPQTISMKANKYIKTILHHWEATNSSSSSSSDLLLDTKKSLFPLLVKLRKTTLDKTQLISLLTIFYHLQRYQFNKSLESYIKLSIGNVAWPIGVVSVSIHARSRDSKLFGGEANIMIDEITRRWITGVKRLISYCEKNMK